ncbi:hypothetical protein MaudCBS49596_006806 [Microsporum audouinii]
MALRLPSKLSCSSQYRLISTRQLRTISVSTAVAKRTFTTPLKACSSLYSQSTYNPRPFSNSSQPSQRSFSGDAQPLSLKEYKFEDSEKTKQIQSSLPQEDATSPSSKPNIILIDVREPPELEATGIIPTALSIPIGSQTDAMFLTPDEFLTRFGFPKPGTEGGDNNTKAKMVFYCKAGIRARTAGELAVRAGYDADRIGVYDGSILDWERNGGKTERWDGPEM